MTQGKCLTTSHDIPDNHAEIYISDGGHVQLYALSENNRVPTIGTFFETHPRFQRLSKEDKEVMLCASFLIYEMNTLLPFIQWYPDQTLAYIKTVTEGSGITILSHPDTLEYIYTGSPIIGAIIFDLVDSEGNESYGVIVAENEHQPPIYYGPNNNQPYYFIQ